MQSRFLDNALELAAFSTQARALVGSEYSISKLKEYKTFGVYHRGTLVAGWALDLRAHQIADAPVGTGSIEMGHALGPCVGVHAFWMSPSLTKASLRVRVWLCLAWSIFKTHKNVVMATSQARELEALYDRIDPVDDVQVSRASYPDGMLDTPVYVVRPRSILNALPSYCLSCVAKALRQGWKSAWTTEEVWMSNKRGSIVRRG